MNSRLFFCVLMLAPSAALAQSATAPVSPPIAPSAEAQTPEESPTQLGTIIVYRGSTVMGAAIACPIRYKGQEIVELGRGKYAEWKVQPGRYILTNKTASVEVTVGAGEVQYVRCRIKVGMWVGLADLQIVDEESFSASRHTYTKKEIAPPASL